MRTILIKSKRYGEKHVLVSNSDYGKVKNFKWHVNHRRGIFYARCNGLHMHRLIVGVNNSRIFVDHIDHNGLNNQRKNIRLGSSADNMKNRSSQIGSTSKYLGVCIYKNTRWRVNIKNKHVGIFDTEEEAARAYDKEAKKLHGKWANLLQIKKTTTMIQPSQKEKAKMVFLDLLFWCSVILLCGFIISLKLHL